MEGHPLGLPARMFDNLHRAALDDEEFVLTIPCLPQVLPVAQHPACAELGQGGDLDIVECRERDLIQVQIGHVSTSSCRQRASLTTATTASPAPARPDPSDRHNTRPTVRP